MKVFCTVYIKIRTPKIFVFRYSYSNAQVYSSLYTTLEWMWREEDVTNSSVGIEFVST